MVNNFHTPEQQPSASTSSPKTGSSQERLLEELETDVSSKESGLARRALANDSLQSPTKKQKDASSFMLPPSPIREPLAQAEEEKTDNL
jgi:hypothetical protein